MVELWPVVVAGISAHSIMPNNKALNRSGGWARNLRLKVAGRRPVRLVVLPLNSSQHVRQWWMGPGGDPWNGGKPRSTGKVWWVT